MKQRSRWWGAALVLGVVTSCVAPVQSDAGGVRPAATPVPPPPNVFVPSAVAPQASDAPFNLTGTARQGVVMYGHVPIGTRALTMNGAPVRVASDGAFLIAFDRDAGPLATLEAVGEDGTVITQTLTVEPGNWRIEQVNASPTGSASSAEFQARRAGELAQIEAARAINPASDGWRQAFVWPVAAHISGQFGAQRIYRGTPGSYHSGVDLAAASGTPFVAPADGVVVLAAQTPFTLEGNLLMIDHGMGLTSAFLHCSRLDVHVGDVVKQGQLLGAVGASGRATGPHLHWGMKWNSSRIDPARLVVRNANE
jgi:murein DD-endopeptidase MepM/ murein hydrolase activator NlpD